MCLHDELWNSILDISLTVNINLESAIGIAFRATKLVCLEKRLSVMFGDTQASKFFFVIIQTLLV